MKKSVFLFAGLLAVSISTFAQQASTEKSAKPIAQAEVLVLGTYHMANRGHDIFNMQVDDVLAPKRQAEIAQLIEVLKKFNPTKIAVERDLLSQNNSTTNEQARQYTDYLTGKHDLSRDEVEQIGFRLAKEHGHKTIYPVNSDYDFPYQRLVNYAKATGRSQELDEIEQIGFRLGKELGLKTIYPVNADYDFPYQRLVNYAK